MTKECYKGHKLLVEGVDYRTFTTKEGYVCTRCIHCDRVYQREYRENNKKERYAYYKEWSIRNPDKMYQYSQRASERRRKQREHERGTEQTD